MKTSYRDKHIVLAAKLSGNTIHITIRMIQGLLDTPGRVKDITLVKDFLLLLIMLPHQLPDFRTFTFFRNISSITGVDNHQILTAIDHHKLIICLIQHRHIVTVFHNIWSLQGRRMKLSKSFGI